MTLEQQRDIIQAAINGIKLQVRKLDSGLKWMAKDIYPGSAFDFLEYEYRIKPEPREFWLEPGRCIDGFYVHEGNFNADRFDFGNGKPIHVREVLD